MKMIRLFAMALLVGVAVETKAQFGPQQDPDSKYATELIKAGTAAPDFKMLKPDGKKFQFAKWACLQTAWHRVLGCIDGYGCRGMEEGY